MTPYPFVKIALMGPAPYGGTFTTDITDPTARRLLDQGYTVGRTWRVVGPRQSETLYVGHPSFARGTCGAKYLHPAIARGYGIDTPVRCDLDPHAEGGHQMTVPEPEASRSGVAVLYFESV